MRTMVFRLRDGGFFFPTRENPFSHLIYYSLPPIFPGAGGSSRDPANLMLRVMEKIKLVHQLPNEVRSWARFFLISIIIVFCILSFHIIVYFYELYCVLDVCSLIERAHSIPAIPAPAAHRPASNPHRVCALDCSGRRCVGACSALRTWRCRIFSLFAH